MYISRLRLTDFRSYESVDLVLRPGTTVFLGPNGYGKTNLVEAVHFLATLGSHRVAADQPLVRAGCDTATVAAIVRAGADDDRSLSLAIDINKTGANRAQLNKAPVRVRDVVGSVRTVFFAPEDLAIVTGDPGGRREFIDEVVTSRWPRLVQVLSEYDRALRQKTALLKALSGRSGRSAGAEADQTLDTWSTLLADLGAQIVAARLCTLLDLAPLIATNYDAIAPVASAAGAVYQSSSVEPGTPPEIDDIRDLLNQRMAERRGEEIARGVCLTGPHRDDIALSLGDLPVRGYASHGEGWSFALALRLASLDLLHADGVDPILILDDVFAELDEQRRSRVVAAMESVEQTLVTAAVRRDLPDNLAGTIFEVERGYVRQAGS